VYFQALEVRLGKVFVETCLPGRELDLPARRGAKCRTGKTQLTFDCRKLRIQEVLGEFGLIIEIAFGTVFEVLGTCLRAL
jgi:hypothetical protein